MERKSSKLDPMIGRIFFNKYTLIKKLGEGSFGSIYSAKSETNWYALKLENKNKGQNLLENEAYIMSYLHGNHIPFIKSFGYSGDYNVLVMELMGKSLENIFENLPIKKMTNNCVAKLGLQMIEILEFIHNKHIIHRDIKPDNFVMGRGEKSKHLFLLDFGLAKKYRSSTTLKHYPMIKKKNLTGTARYASINALNGMTQSRRDDLEAVGYVLLYFLRGKLPWQGLHVKNKEDRYHKIMEIKIQTTPFELCKGFPKEFEDYVEYTRKLQYEEDPDYDFLKNLFKSILKDDIEYIYDWDTGNKTLNTITTSNTSQKGVNINFNENGNEKEKENKKIEEEILNDLDNEINEFDEDMKKIQINNIENINNNKLQNSTKFHNNERGVVINDEDNKINENNDNNNDKDNDNENNSNNENNIDDNNENNNSDNVDKNIAELTEEGKDEDKTPNISGLIHNKQQLERKSQIRKEKDDSCCIII